MRQPFLPHKNAHARDIGKWNQADGAGLRYLSSMISLLSLSWTFLYKTSGVVVSESIYIFTPGHLCHRFVTMASAGKQYLWGVELPR